VNDNTISISDNEAMLGGILHAKSIAVIGASQNVGNKLTGRPVSFLLKHGYKGHLYPVNPRYPELEGLRCYASILEIEGDVDVAMLFVPKARVMSVLEECAKKGVRGVMICSSGFGEVDEEGKALQDAVVAHARSHGMRVFGPNASALVNVKERMVLSFLTGFLNDELIDGNIAFTSNSGTFLSTAVTVAGAKGMGYSYLAALGNESDVSGLSLIPQFVDDPNTRVIAAFVEGIRDWPALQNAAARALDHKKPIVLLKVGSSKRGGQVAASHTGAITGDDRAYTAAFKQHGIIRTDDIVDLIETSLLFSKFDADVAPKTAVIGIGSGGAAELMADLADKHDVDLASFEGPIETKLKEILTPFSILVNPVDVAGMTSDLDEEPRLFRQAMEYLLEEKDIGIFCVAIPLVPYIDQLAQHVVELIETTRKPIIPVLLAGPNFPECAEYFKQHRVPFFTSAEQAVKAIKSFQDYASLLKKRRMAKQVKPVALAPNAQQIAKEVIEACLDRGDTAITLYRATPMLEAYGLRMPEQGLARSRAKAREIAERLGFPLVMKVESPRILHKTEIGGVRLNVKNIEDVERIYEELREIALKATTDEHFDGVLMQRMVPFNTEVILGANHDERLGHVMVAGMGGVWVELFEDVALRLPPVDEALAREMIAETRVSKLLAGFRGKPRADEAALAASMAGFSQLVEDLGAYFSEAELNPIFVLDEGQSAIVGDALFQLRDPRQK
jgi:acetate---CoA ligase (ADP-forming)